jgi:hypothetical protein
MNAWNRAWWPRFGYVCLHAVSGVYAGACLSIALVHVPSIRALGDGARALTAFQLALSAMGRLMLPQLIVMALLMVMLVARRRRLLSRAVIPLAVVLGIVLVTAIVHIPLNRRFLAGDVLATEALPLIQRWLDFHWLRTVLALALPLCVARFLSEKSRGIPSPPSRPAMLVGRTT